MKKILFIIIAFATISVAQTWEEIPTPFFGNVKDIVKNGDGNLIALCKEVGVYLSEDNGENWEKISGDFTGGNYATSYKMSTAPNGDIIYSETEIWRSQDNGYTWEWLSGPSGTVVPTHTTNSSSTLFAAFHSYSSDGIYKYDETNSSWTKVNTGITGNVKSLTYYNSTLFAGTDAGVFSSIDNGDNWIATTNTANTEEIACRADGAIFAGRRKDLQRSFDGGTTWVTSTVDNKIEKINFDSAGNVYITHTGGVLKSIDSGETWNVANTGLPTDYQLGCRSILELADKLFIATNSGVYCSSDSGDNWEYSSNGIRAYSIPGIMQNNIGELFVGGPNGLISTDDNGIIWKSYSYQIGSFTVNIPQFTSSEMNGNGNIFLGGSGCYRSIDNGATWSDIANWTGNGAVSIVCRNNGDVYVAAGYQRIYKSSDNGDNWIETAFSGALSLFIETADGNLLAGDTKSFKRSTDNGDSWEDFGTGFDNLSHISSMIVSPRGKIFAPSWDAKIYFSTDNGATWNKTYETTEVVYNKIVLTDGGVLYAGSNKGIFRSADNGASWTQILIDDIHENVSALYAGHDNYIYVAIHNTGLFRIFDDAVSDVKQVQAEIPTLFELSQNYPNPFNPSTTINYSLPEGGNVTLKIFDTLGQEVATLVNKKQTPGNYEVKFDAGNLSSGIYFYRLKASNFSKTNKMILLE